MLTNPRFFSLAFAVATIVATLGLQAPALAGGSGPETGNLQEAAKEAHTYVFTCDEGFEFVARTESRSTWLFLPSGTVELMKESFDDDSTEKVVFKGKTWRGCGRALH